MLSFNELLRAERRFMSKKELANATGIPYPTIAGIENGDKFPSSAYLNKILNVLVADLPIAEQNTIVRRVFKAWIAEKNKRRKPQVLKKPSDEQLTLYTSDYAAVLLGDERFPF